jgi:nitrogenase molybdenum-iron protein alpha/beta subunit
LIKVKARIYILPMSLSIIIAITSECICEIVLYLMSFGTNNKKFEIKIEEHGIKKYSEKLSFTFITKITLKKNPIGKRNTHYIILFFNYCHFDQ